MSIYLIIAILIIIIPIILSFRRKFLISQMIVISCFFIYFLMIALRFFNIEGFYQFSSDLEFKTIYLKTGEKIYTIITSMYLHGELFHILMNMVVLILAGVPFEERVGAKKFAIIYFISGIGAVILFSLFNLNSPIILIGASGAISGILGAFATLYPRDEIWMILVVIFTKVPVILVAVAYFLIDVLYVVFTIESNVAYIAHIGGLASGVFLGLILKEEKKEIKVDLISLDDLARTDELKELLQKIKKEDIWQIREIWIEEFLKKANCIKCNKMLNLRGKFAYCDCGFVLKWR